MHARITLRPDRLTQQNPSLLKLEVAHLENYLSRKRPQRIYPVKIESSS